jgi:predicted amidohydrolase
MPKDVSKDTSKLELHLDLIPLDLAWSDPKTNVSRMEAAISERLKENPAIDSRSRIFVFPELTLTGFVTTEPEKAALERGDTNVTAVLALAEKYQVAVVFGFPERSGEMKPYNTLLLVDPKGRIVADYQKIHLFTVGNPSEAEVYEAGDAGTLVRYRGWNIGFGICFDLRFSGLFHAYAKNETDLIILPACWLGGSGKARQFLSMSSAHAITGQCFFAALNRSGNDPHYSFEGDVLCFSPKGEPVVNRSGFDLNPSLVEDARKLQVRPSDREEYPVLAVLDEHSSGKESE